MRFLRKAKLVKLLGKLENSGKTEWPFSMGFVYSYIEWLQILVN